MSDLLDAHVLYWSLFDPPRLSTAARQAIDEGESGRAAVWAPSTVLAELYSLLCKV